MTYEFEITYFKASGKYYTNAKFTSKAEHMQHVVDQIRDGFGMGVAPGLSGWHGEFHAVITAPDDCPFGYPCMIPIGR